MYFVPICVFGFSEIYSPQHVQIHTQGPAAFSQQSLRYTDWTGVVAASLTATHM